LDSIYTGGLSQEVCSTLCIQSARIFEQLGDEWGQALSLMLQADYLSFFRQEFDHASGFYQTSLKIFAQLGNDWGQALCLNGLSMIEQKQQNLEESYRLGCQALEIFTRMGNYERLLWIHHNLGEMAVALGKLDEARQHFEANRIYFVQNRDERRIKYYYALIASLGKR